MARTLSGEDVDTIVARLVSVLAETAECRIREWVRQPPAVSGGGAGGAIAESPAVKECSTRAEEPQPQSRRVDPDAIYNVAEASRLIGLNRVRLRGKLQIGIIKGSRKLGTWRIRGEELLRVAGSR